MAAPLTPSAGKCVVVHLLDSAHGRPLQSWRFDNRAVITIGRDESNDVVIVDPQVSRAHAQLILQNGVWNLLSTGRHGTLVNDQIVSEAALQHATTFRLGGGGPTLRFDCEVPAPRRSETIDNIKGDELAMLGVDENRMQQEVDQIAGNDLFRQLREESRRLRTRDGPPKEI